MQEIYKELLEKIDNKYIYIDEEMSKHTTFRIGGPADLFIKVKDIEMLKYILSFSKKENIPVTVMGNGSNLLVKDKGIRGIVIKPEFDNLKILENDIIEVGSGVLLAKLARTAYENSLTGLEFASGIPGTVGGAIYMNAGAYGGEIGNIVVETTYIDENLEIKTINRDSHEFSYRHSIFQEKNWIIITTKIKLGKGNLEDIYDKMEECKRQRREKQPINYPSAGSVFKRGTDYIVPKLIEEVGLKGYKVGGAEISTLHAGFILNTGGATAEDVLCIIDKVKSTIKEKYNKDIELELKIIGD